MESPRVRPSGLTAICAISIVLSVLGLFTCLMLTFNVVGGGEMMQKAMQQNPPVNSMEKLQAR